MSAFELFLTFWLNQAFPFDILKKKLKEKPQDFGKFSFIMFMKLDLAYICLFWAELFLLKKCCFPENTPKTHENAYEYFKILKTHFFGKFTIQHCQN